MQTPHFTAEETDFLVRDLSKSLSLLIGMYRMTAQNLLILSPDLFSHCICRLFFPKIVIFSKRNLHFLNCNNKYNIHFMCCALWWECIGKEKWSFLVVLTSKIMRRISEVKSSFSLIYLCM
jgi:hypothetical protein